MELYLYVVTIALFPPSRLEGVVRKERMWWVCKMWGVSVRKLSGVSLSVLSPLKKGSDQISDSLYLMTTAREGRSYLAKLNNWGWNRRKLGREDNQKGSMLDLGPEFLHSNQQQMTGEEANRYNLYLVLRAEREGLFWLARTNTWHSQP